MPSGAACLPHWPWPRASRGPPSWRPRPWRPRRSSPYERGVPSAVPRCSPWHSGARHSPPGGASSRSSCTIPWASCADPRAGAARADSCRSSIWSATMTSAGSLGSAARVARPSRPRPSRPADTAPTSWHATRHLAERAQPDSLASRVWRGQDRRIGSCSRRCLGHRHRRHWPWRALNSRWPTPAAARKATSGSPSSAWADLVTRVRETHGWLPLRQSCAQRRRCSATACACASRPSSSGASATSPYRRCSASPIRWSAKAGFLGRTGPCR